MKSSREILRQTGLGNVKTLTRWHQRGIIPPPVVQAQPSGAGTMGYWDDWVLDFCVALSRARERGAPFKLALAIARGTVFPAQPHEPITTKVRPILGDALLGDAGEAAWRAFGAFTLAGIEAFFPDEEKYRVVVDWLAHTATRNRVAGVLRRGVEPMLIICGQVADIHALDEVATQARAVRRIGSTDTLTFQGLSPQVLRALRFVEAPFDWPTAAGEDSLEEARRISDDEFGDALLAALSRNAPGHPVTGDENDT